MNEHLGNDPHERARMLIATSGPGELSGEEQSFLAMHLESCASCREFSENAREAIRSLCGMAVTADSQLVSRTQLRVRRRAQELQQQRERLWVISVCCAAVTVSTALTTAVLWQGFAWINGRWSSQFPLFSAPLWEAAFVLFCLTPALLVGILMLARGTYLADDGGSYQH